jgi:hypothetical protein
MRNIKLLFALSITSSLSQANSLSPNNDKFWEKNIEVEQNSVIAKSQCNGRMQLTLDSRMVAQGDFRMDFNIQTSPDDKYYIVNSNASCSSSNKYDCLSSSYLSFSPKTSATLSCWKYQGMTISMGKDGEINFDSDNPKEKELIVKALAKKNPVWPVRNEFRVYF